MKKWVGAAGVCVNTEKQILMVKQGRPEEIKTWAVPSGGLEKGETLEQCCVRELHEETGYDIEIVEKLFVKYEARENVSVEVHYFQVKITGGNPVIQDPDNLIYEIDWKSGVEIDELKLSYPKDRDMIHSFLKQGHGLDAQDEGG